MAVKAHYKNKVSVNMTDEQLEEVKRLSDVQGVSYSEIIRQAFESGLPILRGSNSKTS